MIPLPYVDVDAKARRPSIVESFGIVGLYGYRSISLSSDYAATILIAKNGSGKTTLLGALDAFLKGQFSRLKDLHFDLISCKLRGIDDALILRQEDVADFMDVGDDSEVSRLARRIDIDPFSLLKFVTEDYVALKDDFRALSDEPIYQSLQRTISYRHPEIASTLERLRISLVGKNARIEAINSALRAVLKEVEIVYLPTYRRVELSLIPDTKDVRKRRQRLKFAAGSLFSGDIQFGLSDIYERLADLNNEILVNSNMGYRLSSANIINELIDGTFETDVVNLSEIPKKEELSLFFSRLKQGRRVGPYVGPYMDDVSVPNIDKIYAGDDIPSGSSKFLRYFLSKLNPVIKATQDIERTVEDFVDSCNKYLASNDETTFAGKDKALTYGIGLDDKVLRINRQNLKVHAESVLGSRRISLEALSSGEKQMVSLFAKLYLYPRDKIVLIDEPELSLSMEWQRHILADVMSAPLCRQVIAITHSPFVFDNALDPFAKSLGIEINLTKLPAGDDIEADIGD